MCRGASWEALEGVVTRKPPKPPKGWGASGHCCTKYLWEQVSVWFFSLPLYWHSITLLYAALCSKYMEMKYITDMKGLLHLRIRAPSSSLTYAESHGLLVPVLLLALCVIFRQCLVGCWTLCISYWQFEYGIHGSFQCAFSITWCPTCEVTVILVWWTGPHTHSLSLDDPNINVVTGAGEL